MQKTESNTSKKDSAREAGNLMNKMNAVRKMSNKFKGVLSKASSNKLSMKAKDFVTKRESKLNVNQNATDKTKSIGSTEDYQIGSLEKTNEKQEPESPDVHELAVGPMDSAPAGSLAKQSTMKKALASTKDAAAARKGARRVGTIKEDDDTSSRVRRVDSARSKRKAESTKKGAKGTVARLKAIEDYLEKRFDWQGTQAKAREQKESDKKKKKGSGN